ncbi:NAD-dependent epimerase/dehydratase family protein [Litchfieldia alkalitelluris]|uniref:NAD-dependent epimerase/dehydratase family protein n=1 Tax=Litchfieldia alkalitelluris TaxID=304268 RepID=UPI000996B500|nr:NAD-dependent epimerase/dehydratase family protein [Litchfieldia alkalitelluris]
MTKVIVTGGAGFIGSHIVEELLDHHFEVVVIDNFSSGRRENISHLPVETIDYDITCPKVVDMIVSINPDYIIHQAAQVSVAESVKDPVKDQQVNVKGSLHIIEAAIQSNVTKLVFASSAAVYGNPTRLPISLEHPTNPESPYGLTKMMVEHYLQLSYKLYQLPYSILRYSNVFGPRQDAHGEGGVIAIFTDCLQKGRSPKIYGDGTQTRDFIFVKDVARANVKAMLASENLCLNISTNQSLSINELFKAMKEVAEVDLVSHYVEQRQGDIKHSLLENKATRALLNWEPTFELLDGLAATIEYSRRQSEKREEAVIS